MHVLNYEQIDALIEHRLPPAASLFLPTDPAGGQQDLSRLKRAVDEARAQIQDHAEGTAADEILRPAEQLPGDPLWQRRSRGLACFCGRGFFRAYRLPLSPAEEVVVGDRFCLRPILPLLGSDSRLYVLALTDESARLLEATRDSIRELAILDFNSREIDDARSSSDPRDGRPAGHTSSETLRCFQRVDRTVRNVLQHQRAPLVLACVGFLAPLYQAANGYPNLVRGKVPGIPDRWSDDELRVHAWRFVEPIWRGKQQRAWQTFRQQFGKRGASDDLRTIVAAADQGRVDTLFLARDNPQRRSADPPRLVNDKLAAKGWRAEELLDYAAVKTLRNGGEVFVLDTLPDMRVAAAATFRD